MNFKRDPPKTLAYASAWGTSAMGAGTAQAARRLRGSRRVDRQSRETFDAQVMLEQ
jgi:hypothetical protein